MRGVFPSQFEDTKMENNGLRHLDKWAELEKKAPASVVSSLKKLASAFDSAKMIEWMANLWDPEVGGFYYSNSARDTEGYAPDIESTTQILRILIANGACKSRSELPEDFKLKMMNFIRSCQSPNDGYFYHPQWPKGRENLQNDRYGRDLMWSLTFIDTTTLDEDGDGVQKKQYPNYCILGSKCKKHAGTDQRCEYPPDPPKSSAAPGNTGSKPDFSSREAFSAWLEKYNENIKTNSGNAHQLSSLCNIIADKGYVDIVLDHLDRVNDEIYEEQIAAGIEPTGLWQTDMNYRMVWGLLKYGSFYNGREFGRPLKHPEAIARTCIKVTALPPVGDYRMNDMFNQWLSVEVLMANVKRFNPDKLDAVREILYDDIAPLIDNTLAKISPFALPDGSYAYNPNRLAFTHIYGVPIALGVEEGDVNALALVTLMYASIFTCLGFETVPLFDEEDSKTFLKMISEAKPVAKNPRPDGK